ncbi:hypothetical protein C2845_PM09G21880 [Panicum miliaceum]|uniref:Cathepsin propeptide inhibitor domain-containing protein n=1 Tax=Panicum miliaceum TaxID=4540 RepID=A0A3L6S1G6_PANMI|nr:hypothetical protein C2845_PM09G21880 [Panicum miliaceum]
MSIVSYGERSEEVETRRMFRDWRPRNERTCSSVAEEEEHRYAVFKENRRRIEKHNAAADAGVHSYHLGFNIFAPTKLTRSSARGNRARLSLTTTEKTRTCRTPSTGGKGEGSWPRKSRCSYSGKCSARPGKPPAAVKTSARAQKPNSNVVFSRRDTPAGDPALESRADASVPALPRLVQRGRLVASRRREPPHQLASSEGACSQ